MCLWLFLWFPIFAPFELQLLQLSLGHSFCPRFLCKLVQNEQRRDVFPSCVTRNWPSVQKQELAKSPEVQASWNANPQNNRKNSGAATPNCQRNIEKYTNSSDGCTHRFFSVDLMRVQETWQNPMKKSSIRRKSSAPPAKPHQNMGSVPWLLLQPLLKKDLKKMMFYWQFLMYKSQAKRPAWPK